MKKKLLVTGASGFLGWNICNFSSKTWDVHGTVFSHPVVIPGVKIIQSDLRSYRSLKQVFREVKPDAVIHTAAQKDPNYCEKNRSETVRINVDASVNIAGLSADLGIPCVFTSTDIVFDGLKPPYREEDPVCPVNVYAEQKVMAEEGMYERYSSVTVCRMPLMFGLAGTASSSTLQRMVSAMKEGRELTLFVDEFRSPVSGRDAAEGLMLMMLNARGIVHLGGRERMSRYELGTLLQKIAEMPSARLRACRQADVPMAARRPPDVSLDSTKAFRLGFSPGTAEKRLRELRNELLKW